MENGKGNRSCLGVGTSGRGQDIRKWCRRMNVVEYYALTYENAKLRPAETIPGMGEGRRMIRGEFNYDIL
jgi:hypothetical protein